MMLLKILIIFLFSLYPTFSLYSANPSNIVINEIAWMGTEVSSNDEWIELYNNSSSTINLDGWLLKATDGSPEIRLSGNILAKGFFLLERTDDETLSNISADQIYTGSLKNDGEKLELYDNFSNLIDSIDCSAGWFAGDNKTKQTMERKDPQLSGLDSENWISSQNPGGTPKAENSVFQSPLQLSEPKSESLPETSTEEKSEPKVKTYPAGIIFNEILPSPKGSDSKEEWIEIKNQNKKEVDLSDWQISDEVGKITTYTFPQGTKISPEGFLVLSRKTTKITLNNDGDTLKLFQPNKKIIDSLTYKKAILGQSFNRTEAGWLWSEILTPGSENIVTSSISEIKEKENNKIKIKESSFVPSKKLEKSQDQKQLAALKEQLPQSSNFSLLIAVSLAIFSGVIILILKKKIKESKEFEV